MNEKSLLSECVLTFYDKNKTPMDIKVTTYSYDESKSYENKVDFKIKATDYTNLGTTKIRIQPKTPKALGISFKVETTSRILLAEAELNYNPIESAGIKNSR
jgi:hypothetical protein